jgi:hypothetical protein
MWPAEEFVNYSVPRGLVAAGWSPESALQFVGAMIGALFIFVACRFLRAAGARGAALPAGVLAVCGGALTTHFAGYDKFGPLLLGMALVALGAVYMRRTLAAVWLVATGTALAALSHRSGLLVLPAVAWLIFDGLRAERRPHKQAAIIGAGAAIAAVVAVVLPGTIKTLVSVDAVKHMPGGAVAVARGATQTSPLLLKPVHLLNVLLYLVPLWPAGVVAMALAAHYREGKEASKAKGHVRLGAAAAIGLGAFALMLLVVEPGGGLARDWDIATGAGVLLAFASGYALVRVWARGLAPGTEGTAVLLSLSLCVGIWGLHAREDVALRRLDSLATSAPNWSAATRSWMYDFWGINALNGGRADEAAYRFQRAIDVGGPNPRLYYQLGLAQLAAGRLERARSSFTQAATTRPQASDPWVGLTRVALARRDTLSAIAYLDSALSRNPRLPGGQQWRWSLLRDRAARPEP